MGPGTGEGGERFMKTKTRYAEGSMGEVRIAKDFLPSADQLVLKEEKVTIAVSRRNLGHICQRAGKVQQAKEVVFRKQT